MLPASIYVMFDPTQHGPVHFLFRRHVEIVTGDQIQDLDKTHEQKFYTVTYNKIKFIMPFIQISQNICSEKRKNKSDSGSFMIKPVNTQEVHCTGHRLLVPVS